MSCSWYSRLRNSGETDVIFVFVDVLSESIGVLESCACASGCLHATTFGSVFSIVCCRGLAFGYHKCSHCALEGMIGV